LILRKLTLSNFRQFSGLQSFEFSHPTAKNENNTTVIFGENGRGKTGIFRAIMFGLFGEKLISQDGDVSESEIQLVNVSSLIKNEGKPIETFVELEFSHKNKNYIIKRGILGLQKNDKIIEELSEVRMVETTSDGNTKQIDPSDIEIFVSSILDRRVKDYFLFDGEKIERLTRASVDQRREIGKGIRNLLNIDALETAKKALDHLTKDLETELRKNTTPELAKLLKKLGDNEQLQNQKKQRLNDVGDEATLARNEISKVDKELDKFKEIRGLLDRRKHLEQDLQYLQQQSAEIITGMKSLTIKAASLLVSSTVNKIFTHIEKQKQKGEIPSEIRKDLIEKILLENRCICGNDVCKGTEAYDRILKWKDRTTDVTIQDSALNLWRFLSEINNHFEDDATQVEKSLVAYGNLRNDIGSIHVKLEELRNQIGSSERNDASKLDDHRKILEDKLVKLEAEGVNLQSNLDDLKREHEQLTAQLKEEKQKQGLHDELTRRSTLARDTRDALSSIYDDFTLEIKILIGDYASKLFRELLDSEGRDNLRKLIVNEDYSLQVLDRWDKPFLANISAGQRQIMSISFIAALAQLASKDTLFEMPLFMDTPFGRLSKEHRLNLIKKVPELSSQWILLATDTEFRRQEAKQLKEGKKWGKFYILKSQEDGNTSIIEQNINNALTLLKDEGYN